MSGVACKFDAFLISLGSQGRFRFGLLTFALLPWNAQWASFHLHGVQVVILQI